MKSSHTHPLLVRTRTNVSNPSLGIRLQPIIYTDKNTNSYSFKHTHTEPDTHRGLYLTIGLRSTDREPHNLYNTGTAWEQMRGKPTSYWFTNDKERASLLAASAHWRTDLFLLFHPSSALLIVQLSISHTLSALLSTPLTAPLRHSCPLTLPSRISPAVLFNREEFLQLLLTVGYR